jgi:hypothetical protein
MMLIVDEVFYLVVVVVLESFELAGLQVLHVELRKLVVLSLERLEEIRLAPIQGVSKREEAHRLELDSFDVQACQGLLERGREAELVVQFKQLQLNIEVIGRLFQSVLEDAYSVKSDSISSALEVLVEDLVDD